MNTIPESIYYECHITIEPVFDEKLTAIKSIVSSFGFQVADLLMQKKKNSVPEQSKTDTFCTGRDKSYFILEKRMHDLMIKITSEGYEIYRYKIESVVLDVRVKKLT